MPACLEPNVWNQVSGTKRPGTKCLEPKIFARTVSVRWVVLSASVLLTRDCWCRSCQRVWNHVSGTKCLEPSVWNQASRNQVSGTKRPGLEPSVQESSVWDQILGPSIKVAMRCLESSFIVDGSNLMSRVAPTGLHLGPGQS
jgi:hypothetical protein